MVSILSTMFTILIYLIIIVLILNKLYRGDGKLSVEDMEFLKLVGKQAVGYAEQVYKTNKSEDNRFNIAVNYLYDAVKKSNIKYENVRNLVVGIIESEVLNLPKTHQK